MALKTVKNGPTMEVEQMVKSKRKKSKGQKLLRFLAAK